MLVFTRTKHGADKVVRCARQVADRGRGDPRQQVAEPARARARGVPDRQGAHAGGDRHRRARHRRRGHQPRRQLRPAEHPGELRPPHRPHRARRRRRRRDLVLRWRGARLPARHREADPHHDPVDRSARRPPCGAAAGCASPVEASRSCDGLEPARSRRANGTARSSSRTAAAEQAPARQVRQAGPSKVRAAAQATRCATPAAHNGDHRSSRSATARTISRPATVSISPSAMASTRATAASSAQRPAASTEAQRPAAKPLAIAARAATAVSPRSASCGRRSGRNTMPAALQRAGRRGNGIGREGTCRKKTCSNSMAP